MHLHTECKTNYNESVSAVQSGAGLQGRGGMAVYLFISLATNQKLPSTRTPACLSISALGRWVAARQKSQERIKQEGGTDVRAVGEGKEEKKNKNPTTRGRDERVVISECGWRRREER